MTMLGRDGLKLNKMMYHPEHTQGRPARGHIHISFPILVQFCPKEVINIETHDMNGLKSTLRLQS